LASGANLAWQSSLPQLPIQIFLYFLCPRVSICFLLRQLRIRFSLGLLGRFIGPSPGLTLFDFIRSKIATSCCYSTYGKP
jgi:hypothetical protein